MIENGIMNLKIQTTTGRQIRKWSTNLKKFSTIGVIKFKMLLKELTVNKSKIRTVDLKMSLTTGNKE